MSQLINFINLPPKFTPVYTDGLYFTLITQWQFPRFRYVYDVYVENTKVFTGKANPNPFGLGVVDISKILKNYVNNLPLSYYASTPIYTHETFPFSRPLEDHVVNYEVKFGYEYSADELSPVSGFTGFGDVVYNPTTGEITFEGTLGEPAVTNGIYKTYQATMGVNGRATQQNFDMGPFVLSGTPQNYNPTTTGLFLTNSPRTRNIQESEYYTLGFTNYYLDNTTLSQPYYVQYKFYDNQGTLLGTQNYQNVLGNGGGPMLDCNYVYQSFYDIYPKTNTEYNTLYVGCGPAQIPNMPAGTVQYTVQLFGNFPDPTSPALPTPTPTPTPSSTPVPCSGCTTYDIENTSLFGTSEFTYVDCDSKITVQQFLPSNSVAQVCACNGSIDDKSGTLVITEVKPCGSKPCTNCNTLTIFNDISATGSTSFWLFNCTVNDWVQYTLPPNSGNQYCACPGSVYTKTPLTILTGNTCSTPPPTPTPTPTCSLQEFQIQTCSGKLCAGGQCYCHFGGTITVYANCSVTSPYDEGAVLYTNAGLTVPYSGFYKFGSVIFEASSGVVSQYCVIGGPC